MATLKGKSMPSLTSKVFYTLVTLHFQTAFFFIFTAFLLYIGPVLSLVFILVFYFAPQWGQTNALVYTKFSLMGSLSVSF
nr:probable magnesium transporter NIPA6 isoform X4 [Ipomoea trifida]